MQHGERLAHQGAYGSVGNPARKCYAPQANTADKPATHWSKNTAAVASFHCIALSQGIVHRSTNTAYCDE